MEFQLASSSTEEGEVVEKGFPYYKSHLQYYYYPHTTNYIGKNTVPQFMDFRSDLLCTKLKKDIKTEYPYISLNLLEVCKTFFDNTFKFVSDIKQSPESSNSLTLISTRKNYKTIEKVDKKSIYEGKYEKFYQRILFGKDEEAFCFKTSEYPAVNRLFVMEDRVLKSMNNENAFIFFRCAIDKPSAVSTEKRVLKKYIFEDIFFSKMLFYDYLNFFTNNLVRSHNSEEIAFYTKDDFLLIMYSGTTFLKDGVVKRLHDRVDEKRNSEIICNKEGPLLIDSSLEMPGSVSFIENLDLMEGDYVINNYKIYKIGDGEISFEFKDLLFDDFIRNRWSIK